MTASTAHKLRAVDSKLADTANPEAALPSSRTATVFGKERQLRSPPFSIPPGIEQNAPNTMDGLELLGKLPAAHIPLVFFDPQYRGVLDYQDYGNEGKTRGRERALLRQMDRVEISRFVRAIGRVLAPSGHLFLWVDKFHLCSGIDAWLKGTELFIVDLVVWHKGRLGMGYRTRRSFEGLVIIQKAPKRAKGVWQLHDIPDVWEEAKEKAAHPHRKPIGLQAKLIQAVSNEGDFVVDPAAGSYSVLEACQRTGRNFIGCDVAAHTGDTKARQG